MRKLKVGDIYYWCEPYGSPGVLDRFCIITRQTKSIFNDGLYICSNENNSMQLWGIKKACMKTEITAGRLHYIGRV